MCGVCFDILRLVPKAEWAVVPQVRGRLRQHLQRSFWQRFGQCPDPFRDLYRTGCRGFSRMHLAPCALPALPPCEFPFEEEPFSVVAVRRAIRCLAAPVSTAIFRRQLRPRPPCLRKFRAPPRVNV